MEKDFPIFRNYLEEEDDKPYFSMNSLAYYYEDMERKQKLITDMSKLLLGYDNKLNVNLEEMEKRIAAELGKWDGKVEELPETVNDLLTQWVEDGSLTALMDTTLLDKKADISLVNTKADVSQVNSLTAHLAEEGNKTKRSFSKNNTNRIPTTGININKQKAPLVTFVDDDGNSAVMTKLKPLSETYKIPFVAALIGNGIETGAGVTVEQALDLQNRLGWEMASHEYTHISLEGNAQSVLEYELLYSQEYLRSKGLDVKNLVYPYGSNDTKIREIASKVYNCATSTSPGLNTSPLDTFRLRRLAFPGEAPNNTIAYYKAQVDAAIAGNAWLIWMLHCGQAPHTAEQQALLEELIVYIKSKSVEVVTLQGGLDRMGNAFSINDNQFYMGADGKNNIVNYLSLSPDTITGVEKINADMPPTAFELNKSYSTLIFSATERAKFPSGRTGVFEVVMTSNPTYSYQRYTTDRNIYTRFYASNTAWGAWMQIAWEKPKFTQSVTLGTIAAKSSKQVSIYDTSILAGGILVANPVGAFENGLIWSTPTQGAGAARLRVFNTTDADIVLAVRDWTFTTL